MIRNRFKKEFLPAILTGVFGIVTMAAVLFQRNQIPIPKHIAQIIGFPVLYFGVSLFCWAGYYLKNAIGGLVTPRLDYLVVMGPFRFIRHPTYLAMTLSMVGASIVTRSLVGLLSSVLVFLPIEIHRAKLEEISLEEKFGENWKEYVSNTGFFFPRFGDDRSYNRK